MDILQLAAVVVAITAGLLGILGAAWKWVVLPNLREQLVAPVQETHKQVTENQHLNRPPTVLDRLDDLSRALTDLSDEVQEGFRTMATRVDRGHKIATAAGHAAEGVHKRLTDHEAWAREEDRRLWRELGRHRGDDDQE